MRHKTKSVLAVFLSLAVIFTGCRKMYDQVMEGIEVSYNVNSFLTHQVVVQLVNANSKSTVKPVPVIAIEGQDADKVYDINGGTTIAINNGMAQLVVSPGQKLNGDAVFTIRATAPGFLDYEKQVVITSKDTISNYILPMIERSNPPDGVKVEGLDFEVPTATATTTTSFIQLPLDQNVEFPQRASLTIASGTKFYDNRVRAITGTITTTFTHYNTTDEVVATENPFSSKSFTNVLMKGTVAANDVIYSPLAILDVKMMGSGSKEVFSLSTGMTARLEIASNTYNLVTRTAFAQNNQMEVYGMAVGTTTWQYHSTVSFSTFTSGRLTASLLVNKPGRYIFVPKITPAASRLNLTFTRETSVNTSHFILVTDQNNRKIYSYDQVEVFNGKVWTMPDRLPNAATNIQIFEYDFAGGLKGRQVAQYAITAGATSFTSPVNPQFQLAPSVVNGSNLVLKFDLTGTCSGSTVIAQRYDGKILYKLNAADRYLSLGQAKAGYMEADRLAFGTNYFFSTTVSAPHAKTKKIVTTTFERQRIVWRDPKTGTGGGAPGGIDIDHEVIGYFRLESTKTGNNGTTWEYWTFVKRSEVNGVAQNWIIPATACATYGY